MVLEEQALRQEIDALESELHGLKPELPPGVSLASLLPAGGGPGSWLRDMRAFLQRRRVRGSLEASMAASLDKMVAAQQRTQELRRSLGSLANARRLLAIWHSVHIPLGMALFVAAFVHIGAALYYATLLR